MEDQIKCAKCGSTQITAQKKGFSLGKAAAGAILTGGIGLAAGAIGSGIVMVTCLSCGNSWNPKKLYAEKQRVQQLKSAAAASNWNEWKSKWYHEYRKGDYSKASEIFQQKRYFGTGFDDIHSAFQWYQKQDKDRQKSTLIFAALFIGLIALIIYVCS